MPLTSLCFNQPKLCDESGPIYKLESAREHHIMGLGLVTQLSAVEGSALSLLLTSYCDLEKEFLLSIVIYFFSLEVQN
jgi:hypothetical protein